MEAAGAADLAANSGICWQDLNFLYTEILSIQHKLLFNIVKYDLKVLIYGFFAFGNN